MKPKNVWSLRFILEVFIWCQWRHCLCAKVVNNISRNFN